MFQALGAVEISTAAKRDVPAGVADDCEFAVDRGQADLVREEFSDVLKEFGLSVREAAVEQPTNVCEKLPVTEFLHPADVGTCCRPC